jgi:hypothetical protein
MSGTWRLRLAYRTGWTMSPKAWRCPAHHPNFFLAPNNPVPARPTPSNTPTPRHTHGRTRTPAPIRGRDRLNTIEIIIGRVPTHTPMGVPRQRGPILSRTPSTRALTPTLCTNPRRLSPSRFHSRFPTCIQHRVVHERFLLSSIILYITHTTHRVGGPHTSSDHPSWEAFLHRYGCRTQCVTLIPFFLVRMAWC